MTGQRARTRETVASVAQYILLGGFAAVAAGISAQGLTGFARSNMELTGAWPYLLFLALDGAAGVCAVLPAWPSGVWLPPRAPSTGRTPRTARPLQKRSG